MKSLIARCAFMGMAVLAGSTLGSPHGVSGKPRATEVLATQVAIDASAMLASHLLRGESPRHLPPAMPREGAKFWKWRCDGPRCGYWHRRKSLARLTTGASTSFAHNLSEALLGVENPDLSAAILDHALSQP